MTHKLPGYTLVDDVLQTNQNYKITQKYSGKEVSTSLFSPVFDSDCRIYRCAYAKPKHNI